MSFCHILLKFFFLERLFGFSNSLLGCRRFACQVVVYSAMFVNKTVGLTQWWYRTDNACPIQRNAFCQWTGGARPELCSFGYCVSRQNAWHVASNYLVRMFWNVPVPIFFWCCKQDLFPSLFCLFVAQLAVYKGKTLCHLASVNCFYLCLKCDIAGMPNSEDCVHKLPSMSAGSLASVVLSLELHTLHFIG